MVLWHSTPFVGFDFEGWIPLIKLSQKNVLFLEHRAYVANKIFEEVVNAQRPQVSWLAAHGKGNIEVLEGK